MNLDAFRATVSDLVLAPAGAKLLKYDREFELCGHHPPCSGIDLSHPQLPLTVCLCVCVRACVSLLHMAQPHLSVPRPPLKANFLCSHLILAVPVLVFALLFSPLSTTGYARPSRPVQLGHIVRTERSSQTLHCSVLQQARKQVDEVGEVDL